MGCAVTAAEGWRRPPARVVALALVMVLTVAACGLALWRGWVRPQTIQGLVARAGSAGLVVYVGAVVVAELLWLPRMWSLLAAGILFGPVVGGLLSVVADLSGGSLCFLLARGGGRQYVAGLLGRRRRAAQIVEMLAQRRGVMTLVVLRVCPLGHYTLVSYAAGLGGVRWPAFLLGTGIGLVPGAVLYPIAGDAALRPGSPVFWVSAAVVLVFLTVTVLAARRMLRD